MSRLLVCLCLLALPAAAQARTAEAGDVAVAGLIGPAIKYGPLLGGSAAFFDLALQGEYMVDASWSALADFSAAFAGTLPLRLHGGGRYRLLGLGLPISPYGQVELAYGRLFNVIGADLHYLGGRLGVGADYFLTGTWAAGLTLAADIGSTLGVRPALWGTVDILLYAAYTL